MPMKNKTHKKAKFHLRTQSPIECVTTFVRALYEFADCCNFANKNEEIQDQRVIRTPSIYPRFEAQQGLRKGENL